jgi:hypothetical protein
LPIATLECALLAIGVQFLPVAEHHSKSQLIGEALRDIAILNAVFYPLDELVNTQFQGAKVEWSYVLLIEVGSLIVFWWGVILEGRDEL